MEVGDGRSMDEPRSAGSYSGPPPVYNPPPPTYYVPPAGVPPAAAYYTPPAGYANPYEGKSHSGGGYGGGHGGGHGIYYHKCFIPPPSYYNKYYYGGPSHSYGY